MAKNLEQIFAEVRDGQYVSVTVVTNQDNGIASYATGVLYYQPPVKPVGHVPLPGDWHLQSIPARLATVKSEPLKYYFSDRMLVIDPVPVGPAFPPSARQPFSADATDKLGVSINLERSGGVEEFEVEFTLLSWGNATSKVLLKPLGNTLVGVGGPIGNLTNHAVYVMSFAGPYNPPKIH